MDAFSSTWCPSEFFTQTKRQIRSLIRPTERENEKHFQQRNIGCNFAIWCDMACFIRPLFWDVRVSHGTDLAPDEQYILATVVTVGGIALQLVGSYFGTKNCTPPPTR
eukprot:6016114-Amphidinium_carterae.1